MFRVDLFFLKLTAISLCTKNVFEITNIFYSDTAKKVVKMDLL